MPVATRERTRRRGAGLLLIPLLALVLLGVFWWWTAGDIPNIKVPTPKMPVPNAHDDLTAASNSLIDSNKIDFAIAATHLGQLVDDHPYTLDAKEKLIAENGPALRKFQKALTEEYWAPPTRSFNAPLPYYAGMRHFARFLSLIQQVKQAKGDWAGAFDTGLDSIQMGVQVPHGSILLGLVVGIAVEAIGRRPMWDEIDHLNAAQTRKALIRLRSILAQRFPYEGTLQEEKWAGQAGMLEIFRRSDWAKQLSSVTSTGQGNQDGQAMMQGLWMSLQLSLHGGPRGVIQNYTRHMDALRARARHRYGEKIPEPPIPDDPISQMLFPVFGQVEFKDADTRTEDDLLLTKLALHLYTLEHGAPPPTLEALAPNYLAQLPPDLFAPSGTFHYQPQGKSTLLYSLGPDGRNDGGRPALNTNTVSKGPYARYVVQQDSKGDIVAGVNR